MAKGIRVEIKAWDINYKKLMQFEDVLRTPDDLEKLMEKMDTIAHKFLGNGHRRRR